MGVECSIAGSLKLLVHCATYVGRSEEKKIVRLRRVRAIQYLNGLDFNFKYLSLNYTFLILYRVEDNSEYIDN